MRIQADSQVPPGRALAAPASPVDLSIALSLCCGLVFLLACTGPTAWDSLSRYTEGGLPPLSGLGVDGVRRKTLNLLFWLCSVAPAAGFLVSLGTARGRGLRSAVLLVVLVQNTALFLTIRPLAEARHVLRDGAKFPDLQRLTIVEHTSAGLPAGSTRAAARDAGLANAVAFHRWVRTAYDESRTTLGAEWGLSDEETLKTLFFMNVVSRLWAFGNRHHVERVGCALCNEDNDWQTPSRPDITAYLSSEIGCCNDFAYFVKLLLDQEGIRNRLTMVPDHIFNEVHLGGRWCVVDASTNMFVEAGWQEIYSGDSGGPVKVRLFPHPGLADERSPQYRPFIGPFRLLMLLRVANRPTRTRSVEHPALPDHFD